jgi:V/A-type H+/Na+-transporting ATPase subunit C
MPGAAAYAAIHARVRVMYSTLLPGPEVDRLSETGDYNALVTQLKLTPYGPFLDRVKDKELAPRRAAFQMRGRLAEAYASIISTAPKHTRSLLAQMYRRYEVDNLKGILRGIINGSTWEKVRFVLFPLTSTVLPAQSMVESGNVTAAVELLQGTPYYDTLSYAMKRFSAEQNLFPLEVALDLAYWRKLWSEINHLPREDRVQALHVAGSLLDMNNLMWAIRYRVYYNLSEEELINYTLPFGFRVRDEDIRSIAAGADLALVTSRIFPGLPDLETLFMNPRDGLQRLETMLFRRVAQQCQAAFLGNPFHIGLLLGYLVLQEMEIQDLTVLIEAKSTGATDDNFRPLLVTGSRLN